MQSITSSCCCELTLLRAMRNGFEAVSDKKPSLKNRSASLPSNTSSPHVDKSMELSVTPR
ncbi:hypothetical protein EMIT0P12_20974 [Pseudomonas sp. IT-P12]